MPFHTPRDVEGYVYVFAFCVEINPTHMPDFCHFDHNVRPNALRYNTETQRCEILGTLGTIDINGVPQQGMTGKLIDNMHVQVTFHYNNMGNESSAQLVLGPGTLEQPGVGSWDAKTHSYTYERQGACNLKYD